MASICEADYKPRKGIRRRWSFRGQSAKVKRLSVFGLDKTVFCQRGLLGVFDKPCSKFLERQRSSPNFVLLSVDSGGAAFVAAVGGFGSARGCQVVAAKDNDVAVAHGDEPALVCKRRAAVKNIGIEEKREEGTGFGSFSSSDARYSSSASFFAAM